VLSTSRSPSRFAKRTWALTIQFGHEQTSVVDHGVPVGQ
jgi:hypothetical protein